MQYTVNNQVVKYEALGAKAFGENIVLLDKGIDLTAKCSWSKDGFCIQPLFHDKLYAQFYKNTHTLLLKLWREVGLEVTNDFSSDQYHVYANSWQDHLKFVDKTKLLSVNEFPIPIEELEQRISAICNDDLVVRNPFDGDKVFHFRIIRPNSSDNNPLHRDVWLKDYSDCINLYIPIVGSNELSSLTIIPCSHHWPESRLERTVDGAVINNVRFNVPAVTNINGDYNLIRPNPLDNEVLLFSPYLVHGGASNFNTSLTRISIEVRLWRR